MKKQAKKKDDETVDNEEQGDESGDPYDKVLSKYRFYEYEFTVFVKKEIPEDTYESYAKEVLKSDSAENTEEGGDE